MMNSWPTVMFSANSITSEVYFLSSLDDWKRHKQKWKISSKTQRIWSINILMGEYVEIVLWKALFSLRLISRQI